MCRDVTCHISYSERAGLRRGVQYNLFMVCRRVGVANAGCKKFHQTIVRVQHEHANEPYIGTTNHRLRADGKDEVADFGRSSFPFSDSVLRMLGCVVVSAWPSTINNAVDVHNHCRRRWFSRGRRTYSFSLGQESRTANLYCIVYVFCKRVAVGFSP
jgi:hypothetical protein